MALGAVLGFANACGDDYNVKVSFVEADAGPNDVSGTIGRDINGKVSEVTQQSDASKDSKADSSSDSKIAICTTDLFKAVTQCKKPLPPMPKIDPCTLDAKVEIDETLALAQEVLDNIDCVLSRSDAKVDKKVDGDDVSITTGEGKVVFSNDDGGKKGESVIFRTHYKPGENEALEYILIAGLEKEVATNTIVVLNTFTGDCTDERKSFVNGMAYSSSVDSGVNNSVFMLNTKAPNVCKIGNEDTEDICKANSASVELNSASVELSCGTDKQWNNYRVQKKVNIPHKVANDVVQKARLGIKALRAKHGVKF